MRRTQDGFSGEKAFPPVSFRNKAGTGIERFHPAVAALLFLCVALLPIFLANPVLHATLFVSGLCMALMLRHTKNGMGYYLWTLFLGLGIVLTNPLISQRGQSVLFFLNGNPISVEALYYGLFDALLMMGVILWCRVWNTVMTTNRMMFLLGGMIPKASLVLTCALRFFPLMIARWKSIRRTQKAIGCESEGVRAAASQFSALVTWAMETSIGMAASMRARGYGLKGRKNYSEYHMTAEDWILTAAVLILTATVAVAAAMGRMEYAYYPTMQALQTDPIAIAGYAAFGILAFVPFLIEIGDVIRWKSLRQKI